MIETDDAVAHMAITDKAAGASAHACASRSAALERVAHCFYSPHMSSTSAAMLCNAHDTAIGLQQSHSRHTQDYITLLVTACCQICQWTLLVQRGAASDKKKSGAAD
eukprot:8198-Heterococcus_DN1.PRE.4